MARHQAPLLGVVRKAWHSQAKENWLWTTCRKLVSLVILIFIEGSPVQFFHLSICTIRDLGGLYKKSFFPYFNCSSAVSVGWRNGCSTHSRVSVKLLEPTGVINGINL